MYPLPTVPRNYRSQGDVDTDTMETQKAPRGSLGGPRGPPPRPAAAGLSAGGCAGGILQTSPGRARPLSLGGVRAVDVHRVLRGQSLKDIKLLPALQPRGFRNNAPSTRRDRDALGGLTGGCWEPRLASPLPSAGVSPPLPQGTPIQPRLNQAGCSEAGPADLASVLGQHPSSPRRTSTASRPPAQALPAHRTGVLPVVPPSRGGD